MDPQDRSDESTTTECACHPGKRVYAKPELVEYGNVRDLTRGSATKSFDFHNATRQAV